MTTCSASGSCSVSHVFSEWVLQCIPYIASGSCSVSHEFSKWVWQHIPYTQQVGLAAYPMHSVSGSCSISHILSKWVLQRIAPSLPAPPFRTRSPATSVHAFQGPRCCRWLAWHTPRMLRVCICLEAGGPAGCFRRFPCARDACLCPYPASAPLCMLGTWRCVSIGLPCGRVSPKLNRVSTGRCLSSTWRHGCA